LGFKTKDDPMKGLSLAAALLLTAAGSARAQEEIKWTESINLPKGQNMPRDRADILGIELGDTYAEAKAKMEKLAAEGNQPPAQAIQEARRVYRFRTPGAQNPVSASFVQSVVLTRQLPGASGKRYTDVISIDLTAPSSGHQVMAIRRTIVYGADSDQPLISEVVAQLRQKMQFEPQMISAVENKYRFQFDNGKPFMPAHPTVNGCDRAGYSVADEIYVKTINGTGNCDAHMEMSAQTGISRNHARSLDFILSDNERAKANLAADFAFLSEYVAKVQQNTRGAPPKL
jgi:hypothetical protein